MEVIQALKIAPGDYTTLEAEFYFSYPKSTSKKHLIDGQPHRKKPDADNVVKGLKDALTQAGILADDGQIAELVVRKRYTTQAAGHIKFSLS